ncbi:aldehyde dehydrogenase [Arthrobacter ginkgonis]|uniref:Aldehyde dehydrogenase n=1 Tax=Arthrobacter ginkgonis TaxID=1630594 RepID=A0ABP7CKS4_9MICC
MSVHETAPAVPLSDGQSAAGQHRDGMYCGGQWIAPPQGRERKLRDPSTGAPLGTVSLAGADDADALVAAAERSAAGWAGCGPVRRAEILEAIAERWEARGEELAELVSREMGMPLGASRGNNVHGPVAVLRYYAGLARGLETVERRAPLLFDGTVSIHRAPLGVVAAIVPWNYPWMLLATKLGPALAAGCPVIVKPAEENALSARLLATVLDEAGVPPGVVNVAVGGADLAAALVAHPGVAKVAFTGSTAVGRSIGATVGGRLAASNLELGGKSAAIVLDDADLDLTLSRLPALSYLNSGQTCFAQTRVIATPGIYERIVEGYREYVQAQRVGPALDESSALGPVASAAARDRIEGAITGAVSAGARLIRPALPADLPPDGHYVAPAVLADVDNDWPVAREEIFGPVVCLIRARDAEDAVRLANDNAYGLAGTVWTRDLDVARDIAARVQAGSFGINGYLPDLGAPWGGVKASGTGREQGPEAIEGFLRADTVYEFGS